MKQQLALGVVLVAVFAKSAEATPPPCQRWKQSTSDCEILKKAQDCVPTKLEIEKKINPVRFAYSAHKACENYLKVKYPSVGKNFESWEVNPTTERCVWDINRDGEIDDADASQAGVLVDYVTITPDDHCFCTVTNGPYQGLAWSGILGTTPLQILQVLWFHYFPNALKSAVLLANKANHGGQYWSDAPFENTPLQKVDVTEIDAAEIDHIIPRVDSKGCLCGDPTPENAAVISKGLNGKMSNTSPNNSYYRAKMYQAFGVTCDDPSAAVWDTYLGTAPPIVDIEPVYDADETTLGIEIDGDNLPQTRGTPYLAPKPSSGGCSTSAGGGLGLALALLLVRRRRR